ncbi:DUF333 domain-containing protein [Solidesulfovibrio sp.]|uniref:putative hemolysin n=1 Tax=Solidesulfovibrio sp. TaxID=2910990 RepID=UPI002B1F99FA|nr:DUF333 domain-containing protein [Solidesulfovibrio sp.]MEA5090883.1 DUF333 domain-containing protein [Solidesulfovibrio sp.]HML62934.1 DUF333 domain-containing protein [Solidesulfovibrio sp.]
MRHALLLAALCGLLACACPVARAQPVGMPNPASTYCVESGGTLVIGETGSGEVGTCVYAGGLAVDEWALYRFFSPMADLLSW